MIFRSFGRKALRRLSTFGCGDSRFLFLILPFEDVEHLMPASLTR